MLQTHKLSNRTAHLMELDKKLVVYIYIYIYIYMRIIMMRNMEPSLNANTRYKDI